MKHPRSILSQILCILLVAAASASGSAYADDYSDVSQLLRAGKLVEAMNKAETYLTTKPTDPQMRFLKGVIQRSAGKQNEAIATFTKLTEDFPELPEPYNNLAVLYAGQSQFDKARSALEMAIRTNPSYATAHENLGDVYARLASQAYNKALQLDGANAAVQPKLALIREVFKPNLNNQRPLPATPASAPPPAPAPAPAPAQTVAPVIPPPPVPTVVAKIPTPSPSLPVKPALNDSTAKDVEASVHAWAKAWSTKDLNGYLGAYGKDFDPPGKQSRSQWEDERRKRITGKSSISVKLEKLVVTVSGNKANVKFKQDYKANALAVSSRKTLEMVKTGDKWLIVKESTGN
jgi:Flp pilus assembly protein TadD/ketosteroid isomerase-like protein